MIKCENGKKNNEMDCAILKILNLSSKWFKSQNIVQDYGRDRRRVVTGVIDLVDWAEAHRLAGTVVSESWSLEGRRTIRWTIWSRLK